MGVAGGGVTVLVGEIDGLGVSMVGVGGSAAGAGGSAVGGGWTEERLPQG